MRYLQDVAASEGAKSVVISGHAKYDPVTVVLAAHLLQQSVDERAPEHVEKTASTYSIGA